MIILKENSLKENRNPALVKVTYDKNRKKLKATIDVDCAEIADSEYLDYDKFRYKIDWATPDHVAFVLSKHIDEIRWLAINDDHSLAARLAAMGPNKKL